MASLTCDVILPVYNSGAVIADTIAALAKQSLSDTTVPRLIIIDDGSTDDTITRAERICRQHRLKVSLLRSAHHGVATARNLALQHATADLILLLGADILLRPGALAAHLAVHRRHLSPRLATLGLVRWDPRLRPTPFMEWMTHGGPQNDFDGLLGKLSAPPAHYWYASHLVCPRRLLTQHRFAEAFAAYGWEDLELGRRLAACGITLRPLLHAVGLHHHGYSAANIFHRQRLSGRSLRCYQELHPAVSLLPRRSLLGRLRHHLLVRTGLHTVLKHLLAYTSTQYATPRLFALTTTTEFWQGVYSTAKSCHNRKRPKSTS